jgi:uncharacterized protein YndB with AHSA1/START domain
VIVERRIVLPAGPEEAWAVVLDFAGWFCEEASIERAAPGARAEFRWSNGIARAAVFEDVEAPRFLSFRWLPFERHPTGDTVARPFARVEITLEPVDDGVEITVVERRLDSAIAGAFAGAIA